MTKLMIEVLVSMQPVFSATTRQDEEAICNMIAARQTIFQKSPLFALYGITLFTVFFLSLRIESENPVIDWIVRICLVGFTAYLIRPLWDAGRKSARRRAAALSLRRTGGYPVSMSFRFYEDRVEIEGRDQTAERSYQEFEAVGETDGYYLLFPSLAFCYAVRKEDVEQRDAGRLTAFLNARLKKPCVRIKG